MRTATFTVILIFFGSLLPANDARNLSTNVVYSTLAAAIETAAPGQRIELLRDVSAGALTIDRQITLEGRGHTLTHVGNGFIGQAAITVTADDVILRELTISGGLHGIRLSGGDGLLVSGLTVEDVVVHGLFASEMARLTVQESTFTQAGAEAIRLRNVATVILKDLSFDGTGATKQGESILLETSVAAAGSVSAARTDGIVIEGNVTTRGESLFALLGDGATMPTIPTYNPSAGSTLPADFSFRTGSPHRSLYFIYGASQVETTVADLLACGPTAPTTVYLYDEKAGEFLIRPALLTSNGLRTLRLRPQAAVEAAAGSGIIRIYAGAYLGDVDTGNADVQIRFGQ